jgi:hypothetical protein
MPKTKGKTGGTAEVTVRDIVTALDAIDTWIRMVREAVASLDPDQVVPIPPAPPLAKPPTVSGRLC